MQRPFAIPNWNLDTCIFVAWTKNYFHHTVVSAIVLAALPQYDVAMHAMGPIAIAPIHRQFNSPRLVKREAGFPNPRRVLIGSNQLWRVSDSPYYR